MHTVNIKRIYDPVSDTDGFRVLVDRLWPRGISKEKAHIDVWAKEVTPSSALRKEYHQNLIDFKAFNTQYQAELIQNQGLEAFVELVKEKLAEGNVTFLTASKNMEGNHAEILKEWVETR